MKKKLGLPSNYILGIVGIVALVGIVMMVLNNGVSTDVSGQAIMKSKTTGSCTDSDDWYTYYTEMPGTTTFVTSSGRRLSGTDFCSGDVLTEYYCGSGSIQSMTVDCADEDMICSEGACTPPGSRY